MSFQYINPNHLNQRYVYNYQYQPAINQNSGYIYASNPYQAQYQTSFYNQNVSYPYNNPNFAPQINSNYTSLGAAKTDGGNDLYLYRLKNGHNIAIMPKKNSGTIVKTYLNGGSMNETDELRGISHTIEHMLFKGSKNYKDGDVFRLTGKMGASTNASTDFAQTDYYISAPYLDSDDVKTVLELQGDMISNPLFEKSALESEKNPICSEISMMDDSVESPAFDKVVRNLFRINSNSHNLVAGSIDTVQSLKSSDLSNHHEKYYAPNDLYTVVVGDVDPDYVIDLISKNYTVKTSPLQYNQHKEKLNPIQVSKREDYKSSKTNSTTVLMAFEGPKPKDGRDFIIGEMVDYYLSDCYASKLKNGLEEMSGSFDTTYQKVGLSSDEPVANINLLSLNPLDEQKGIDLFYDTIIELQNRQLDDDEMCAVKNYMQKYCELINCSSDAICDQLARGYMNNSLDTFLNYRSIVQDITKEDIQEYIRKYYDLNKVSMVVVHPSNVDDSEIEKNYNNSKYSLAPKRSNISFGGRIPNITTNSVNQYKLKNNTNAAINKTDSDFCAFHWTITTPPLKAKNPNIPLVLTYMFKKGSEYLNQDELEKYEDLNGITANVDAYGKSVEISANCVPQNSAKALALMNELMYHPKLTQNDFEQAKRYVKDLLKTSQKDANTPLLDKLYPGFFPTDTQMLKQIDELTLDDIKDFYKQLLQNGSSSFCATIPSDKYPFIENAIFEYQSAGGINFKDKVEKPASIYKENDEQTVIYDTDDLNQAQIYKSYQFPLSGNIEDEAKFELVNTILGGSSNARLFADLREKENLAYSVYSSINSFENTGVLTLEIQTTTDNPDSGTTSYDNVQKSLEGFSKHTDKMCSELVTDEELQSAKTRLKQKLISQTQDPVSYTDLLDMNIQQPYGIRRIDKYIEAIDKITKEDIKNAANFIFSRKPTISILASEDTINSQMEYLKTQGQLVHA